MSPTSTPDGTDLSDERLGRFIERSASALAEMGWPRMAARVFTALIVSESGRMDAAQFAEQLLVSPAAVSGAVRYLTDADLMARERDPGSRRDHYRTDGMLWQHTMGARQRALARWAECLAEGLEVLGEDSPAGQRMAETLAFFEFLRGELPGLLEKWRAHKGAENAS